VDLELQAAMLGTEHALLTIRTDVEPVAEDESRVAELEAALGSIRSTLNSLGIGGPTESDGRHELPASLTVRQHEVTELLLAGMRESEIAKALFISEHTVRNHKKAAFRALDVHSMTELLSTYRPSLSMIA
jgi:DNA-binding NarL/FixJ family response regulator